MKQRRTLDQNARFHAMVRDIAHQVPFAGEMISEDEWKHFILAGAFGWEIVPNPLGFGEPYLIRNKKRSSQLPQSGENSMHELITQLIAFGNEKGVRWTDPEWQSYLAEIGQ